MNGHTTKNLKRAIAYNSGNITKNQWRNAKRRFNSLPWNLRAKFIETLFSLDLAQLNKEVQEKYNKTLDNNPAKE